jgi:hypothetical protein
MTSAPRS